MLIPFLLLINLVWSTPGILKTRYLVTDLPGLSQNIPHDEIPLMYSGQVIINQTSNTRYFFWKFIDSKVENNKLTFWFNGGPGCSSMEGALMENGPFRINSNLEVEHNEFSWHKLSNMVYVDQPGGVGLSTTDEYNSDSKQVGDYYLTFLERYFEIFPEDLTKEIYLSGESYAGQYIPYVAKGILERNEGLKKGQVKYKLKGLLIGNGSVSPIQQSLSFLPLFIEKGLFNKDQYGYDLVLEKHKQCQKIVEQIDETFNDGKIHHYETNRTFCSGMLQDLKNLTLDSSAPLNQQCINVYDYKLRDSFPSCGANFPPDKPLVTKFLNDEYVLTQLHVEDKSEWMGCNPNVSEHYNILDTLPSVHLLPELIEKLNVILFSGADDIICNTKGALLYLNKLKWNNGIGFTTQKQDWVIDDEKVGWIIQDRGLRFIEIYNASHMVSYNVPKTSQSLFKFLLQSNSVYNQPIDQYRLQL